MADEIEKDFVKSFVGFLRKKIENQTLSPDASESLEVAVQCLEAAFDLSIDENQQQQQQPPPQPQQSGSGQVSTLASGTNIDLFDMFQSLYSEKNPESKELAEQIKNDGNRLMKEGKFQEALLQYTRAVTLNPKNPVLYCNRAAAFIRLGENDKAIADCKLALAYNPDYGKAYGRMGIAYSNMNKFAEATEAFKKATALEPTNEDYKNNLQLAESKMNPQVNFITGLIDSFATNPEYAAASEMLFNQFSGFLPNSRDGTLTEGQLGEVLQNFGRAVMTFGQQSPGGNGNPPRSDRADPTQPPQPPPTS